MKNSSPLFRIVGVFLALCLSFPNAAWSLRPQAKEEQVAGLEELNLALADTSPDLPLPAIAQPVFQPLGPNLTGGLEEAPGVGKLTELFFEEQGVRSRLEGLLDHVRMEPEKYGPPEKALRQELRDPELSFVFRGRFATIDGFITASWAISEPNPETVYVNLLGIDAEDEAFIRIGVELMQAVINAATTQGARRVVAYLEVEDPEGLALFEGMKGRPIDWIGPDRDGSLGVKDMVLYEWTLYGPPSKPLSSRFGSSSSSSSSSGGLEEFNRGSSGSWWPEDPTRRAIIGLGAGAFALAGLGTLYSVFWGGPAPQVEQGGLQNAPAPNAAQPAAVGALAPLRDYLGPDADIGFISWEPVDFDKSVRAGFTTVWIDMGHFLPTKRVEGERVVFEVNKHGRILRNARESGIQTLGFIGSNRLWVDPEQPGHREEALSMYRRLLSILEDYIKTDPTGELKFAFGVDIEPHADPAWDGNLVPYSRFLSSDLVPILGPFARRHPGHVQQPFLTRIEPFWWRNSGTTFSGQSIQGLADFPANLAPMTYRVDAGELLSTSAPARERVRRVAGSKMFLVVNTQSGLASSEGDSFHGRFDQISPTLIQTIGRLPREDRRLLRGVMINAEPNQANQVLDTLLRTQVRGGLEELGQAVMEPEVQSSLQNNGMAAFGNGFLVREATFNLDSQTRLFIQGGLEEPEGLPGTASVVWANETTVAGMLEFLLELAGQAGIRSTDNFLFNGQYFTRTQAMAVLPVQHPMPASAILSPGLSPTASQVAAILHISRQTGTIYVANLISFTASDGESYLFIQIQA